MITKFLKYVDSEEVFDKNMSDPEKKRLLELNNWTKDSITYHINEHGFRSGKFQENGIVFLGCSFTHGLGLALEDTWVYKVAQEFNLPINNLGKVAYGGDGCFRLAREYVPKLNPKMVFFLAPSKNRLEIKMNKHNYQPLGVDLLNPAVQHRHKQMGIEGYVSFITDWFMQEENAQLNFEKNLMAIQYLCRDTKFYYLSSEDFYETPPESDLARDLHHPGRKWQDNIAKKFIDMAKNG